MAGYTRLKLRERSGPQIEVSLGSYQHIDEIESQGIDGIFLGESTVEKRQELRTSNI